jgi:REP element-mobilizing transposase RayT
MPKPRSAQIAIEETPYYHLVSRCVRRAFLCGCTETYNFEHRRHWILERLSLLTQMFAIDVAAFALMSNHYHLVVRIDSEQKFGLLMKLFNIGSCYSDCRFWWIDTYRRLHKVQPNCKPLKE